MEFVGHWLDSTRTHVPRLLLRMPEDQEDAEKPVQVAEQQRHDGQESFSQHRIPESDQPSSAARLAHHDPKLLEGGERSWCDSAALQPASVLPPPTTKNQI